MFLKNNNLGSHLRVPGSRVPGPTFTICRFWKLSIEAVSKIIKSKQKDSKKSVFIGIKYCIYEIKCH